jgi:hypothetical protein
MKVFVSVKVKDHSEEFIFGHQLRKRQFELSGNHNWENQGLDFFAKRQIGWSKLFLGLITTSKDIQNVLDEWHYAQSKGIPNLLLVEDAVRFSEPLLGNVIVFNRKKPQKAIDFIKKQMEMTLPSATLKREDVMAWTLGGEALIDILEWFERNQKREKQEREAVAA